MEQDKHGIEQRNSMKTLYGSRLALLLTFLSISSISLIVGSHSSPAITIEKTIQIQQSPKQISYTNNTGATISIQRIPINSSNMYSFWIGEYLANNAYIQIGYLVPNITTEYANNCSIKNCTSQITVYKGKAYWFYEYFPPNVSKSFYGKLGALGNATFNTYSFNAINTKWNFYVDNVLVGNENMNTSNSGKNVPSWHTECHGLCNVAKPIANFTNFSVMK